MKNPAKADFRRRQIFYDQNCRELFFKYIINSNCIPQTIKQFYKKQSFLSLKLKIRNRCILTGRGRGVYRFCKLSRSVLQEKALAGMLNGYSKTSW